jgi:hypothetical protein
MFRMGAVLDVVCVVRAQSPRSPRQSAGIDTFRASGRGAVEA